MSNIWDTEKAANIEQLRRYGVLTHSEAKRCRCGHNSYKRTSGDEACLECVMKSEAEKRKEGVR